MRSGNPSTQKGKRRYSLMFIEYETSEIDNTDEEAKKGFVFVKLNGKIKAFKPNYTYERYNERGSGLYFKNEKLAQYACMQFGSEWIRYFRS